MAFPAMFRVKQQLKSARIGEPGGALAEALQSDEIDGMIRPGCRVAIAVGSRNIDGLVPVVVRLVREIQERGSKPFVVPAMGSHGGATAEGQIEVLKTLGIEEATLGAPVVASMETVALGTTPGGAEAFCDRAAFESDAIIPVNRVAPHTVYDGSIQSGLLKMMAVGLGKRDGARSLHRHGFGAPHLIGEMADVIMKKAPVAFGIAIIEDGGKRISGIEALGRGSIRRREPELLASALSIYSRLPLEKADILLVDEMGKDISGIGMDPYVTGRGKPSIAGIPGAFSAERIVVLRLTPGSAGNATGVGLADITTRGFLESMDRDVTYMNVLTSGELEKARVPILADSEKEAIAMAIESLGDPSPSSVRLVRIQNTRELGNFHVSEALAEELSARPGVSVDPAPREIMFDHHGSIV